MRHISDWLRRKLKVELVHEDPSILVLNKPAGMLVVPDRFRPDLPNLFSFLKEQLGSIYVVHRIDKETSGLVVFAKTPDAHAHLNRQFEGRHVEKKYLALVKGVSSVSSGTISHPLSEGWDGRRMKIDEKKGKEAVTDFSILESFQGYAFVEVRPKTGRMHQIRVHLRSLGLPIVGDDLYRDGKGLFLSEFKKKYKSDGVEKPLIDRLALHASELKLAHPLTDDRLQFEAPLPKDLTIALQALRKYARTRGNAQIRFRTTLPEVRSVW
jgi:23S rRNA pseudouridine955/2504/2580 synthase/23S rRNA pseudouridine1911/1915/1917 synthase